MIRSILAALTAGLFLILGIPVLLVEWIIGKFNPLGAEHTQLSLMRWISRVLTKICGVRLELRGEENVPTDTPVLYIGNHNSIFDCLCLYPVLRERFGFIAKDSLKKVPLLSTWMARTNTLYLDRNNTREGMKVILKAIDMVKDGVSIFIFPEGTRGDSEEMGEFKAGSFKIASKANVPIIPVTISGTREIISNHFPSAKPTKVIISFGKPIIIDELDPEDKKHIASYVQNIMIETKASQDAEI